MRIVPAAALAWLLLPGTSHAAPATPLPEQTATFVLGNVQFMLVHELAHLVIGELDVPVLGPEENAADYLATLALIRAERRDPVRNERYRGYLLAAADAQRLAWQKGVQLGAPVPYWDAHALTIQRFYQIACLLYGADPALYRDLPVRIGMPAGRARSCAAEFERANRAVNWLLATYGRQPGEPPGEPVGIRYEEAPTLAALQVAEEMRRTELLEATAARVTELFRLPRAIEIVVRGCARAEAAWQPDRRELTVCYELLDTFYRMAPRS